MIKNNITVIDALCGKGKTSWAIQEMRENYNSKFIFITPYLNEIDRVKKALKGYRQINEPMASKSYQNEKYEPVEFFDVIANKEYDTKSKDFERLVREGKDICSTHQLFKNLSPYIIDLIRQQGYTLILDECINVVNTIVITTEDFELLIDSHRMRVEDNKIVWLDMEYDGKFSDLKRLALNKNLLVSTLNNKEGKGGYKTLLTWLFPIELFKCFSEVYILTYMIDCQLQGYYYRFNNVDYEKKSVIKSNGRYELTDYNNKLDGREDLAKLINIIEDEKLNEIGRCKGNARPLSSSWYDRADNEMLKQVQNNTYNFLRNRVKSKSDLAMWTCYKKLRDKIKPRGYVREFTSFNLRATNDFRHKTNLAYLINLYDIPSNTSYFKHNGIQINDDAWAISELIQWLFRSALREGKAINLYIPSHRMRTLLKKYLAYEELTYSVDDVKSYV